MALDRLQLVPILKPLQPSTGEVDGIIGNVELLSELAPFGLDELASDRQLFVLALQNPGEQCLLQLRKVDCARSLGMKSSAAERLEFLVPFEDF